MKSNVIFLNLCLSFFFGFPALGEEPLHKTDPMKFLTLQNYRVLSGRIFKIFEYRFADLSQCSAEVQKTISSRYKSLPKFSDQKEIVLEFLSLYRDSFNVEKKCFMSLEKNEKRFKDFEREKFKNIHSGLDRFCQPDEGQSTGSIERRCVFKYHQVWSELDPHCVSFQVPNISNVVDPFPCMMADYLIGKIMVNDKNWDSYVEDSSQFVIRIYQALSQPMTDPRGLDLWEMFRNARTDTKELRENFLAQLNFFFTSSQSGSSYIRGFHDHIWQYILRKTSSPEKTLEYFVATRLKVNEFLALNDWMVKNNVKMHIRGITMSGKNRHNYMAAFLACHYRDEGKFFNEHLPVTLGYGYETLDFKSHMIDEKLSFKDSYENFDTDTNRYRTGVYWGLRFCRQEF